MPRRISVMWGIAALVIAPCFVSAQDITGGAATLTLEEGTAASISTFDAYFDSSVSRSDCLSDPAPGNEAFTRTGTPGSGTVTLTDPIRPFGITPTPYPGTPGSTRSPQITNLDVNPSNILGSWAQSTDEYGDFVALGTGQQIAFTSMQRWTGPFTGSLLYGDFGLRYVSDRAGESEGGETLSGLVLTSNIDFLNASFADIGNATVSFAFGNLTVSGDLLISGALNVLDSSAVVGTKFGTFTMVSVTPEPSSIGFLSAGAATLLLRRRRSA